MRAESKIGVRSEDFLGKTGIPKQPNQCMRTKNVFRLVGYWKKTMQMKHSPNSGSEILSEPNALFPTHVQVNVNMTVNGGKIGFFNGDVRKLKDDLTTLKPTVFCSVPRLFNKFFDTIMNKIE